MGDEAKKPASNAVQEARMAAKEEVAKLMEFSKSFEEVGGPDIATKVIADGGGKEEFLAELAKAQKAAYAKRQDEIRAMDNPPPDPSSSGYELEKFSLLRTAEALANPGSKAVREAAGYEMELLGDYNDQIKKSAARPTYSGYSMPHVMLLDPASQRDAIQAIRAAGPTTSADASGAALISTDHLANLFIDWLYSLDPLTSRVTTLSGLVGDLEIPKADAAVIAGWTDEATTAAAIQAITAKTVELTPKQLIAVASFTRKMRLQSTPMIDGLIRTHLQRKVLEAICTAILQGKGADNQPKGVLNQTGIHAEAAATSGTAPDWANTLKLAGAPAAKNAAIGEGAFVSNAALATRLMAVPKEAGHPNYILQPSGGGGMIGAWPHLATNVLKSKVKNQKSTSPLFFGHWSQVLLGTWSGIDLLVNPYADDIKRVIRMTVYQDVDIAVTYGESFAVREDTREVA